MKLDYGIFDDAFRNVVVTPAELQEIMPHCGVSRARTYAHPLAEAMKDWHINNPRRAAGFLANIAHESGSLHYVREIADGKKYEGRRDLGNTEPGDGERYRGRGLIQITGRANMRLCSIALFNDPDLLLACPEKLEEPVYAASSAGWFWKWKGLNDYMDSGDFRGACSIINTGRPDTPPSRINGWDERLAFYHRACKVLEC